MIKVTLLACSGKSCRRACQVVGIRAVHQEQVVDGDLSRFQAPGEFYARQSLVIKTWFRVSSERSSRRC